MLLPPQRRESKMTNKKVDVVAIANLMWGLCSQHIMRPRCTDPGTIKSFMRLIPVDVAKELRLQEIYTATVEAGVYMKQFEPDFYNEKPEWCRWYVEKNNSSLRDAMLAWNYKDLDMRTAP